MMKNNSLFFITLFQEDPTELLNCSKQFTIGRRHDLRCRNMIYFRDERIKVMTYGFSKEIWIQEWYKNGKLHRDNVDPETGLTLPAKIISTGTKYWYKNGKIHREEVDPETGLTLPALIWSNGRKKGKKKVWYKDGKIHRDDVDPETRLILPALISSYGAEKWYKNGKKHREEVDPETGLTLPAVIHCNGAKEWWNNGIRQEPPQ